MLFPGLRLLLAVWIVGVTSVAVAAPTSAPKRTASKVARAKKQPRYAPVELFHVNRRETLKLQIADNRGRPVRGAQKRVERFLRCHYTNKQFRMNPRLTRLLYETGRRYPGRRLEVVSGYRHPKVAKNPRSPHMKGLACDFRVAGISNTELRDYLRRTFKNIGVGYYPNSSFVHLDVRSGPSAFWIDYSGPGESAMYSENPGEDLKTGRAESWKPAKIDPSWAESDAALPVSSTTPAAPLQPDPSGL